MFIFFFFFPDRRVIIPYVVWAQEVVTKSCKGLFNLIYAITSVLVLAFVIFLYVQSSGYTTVEYEIQTRKDTGPVRFVMISDLHDTDVTHDHNKKLLDSIMAFSPDFVVLAGDMITSYMEPTDRSATAFEFLKELSKRVAVYYGLGNHEQRYKAEPDRFPGKYEELEAYVKDLGISFLSDDKADICNGKIRIYGFDVPIENYRRAVSSTLPEGILNNTFGPLDDEKFNILLAHDPVYFDDYAAFGPDLVLSGHLHGGIVAIPGIGGVISPQLKLFPKYYGGRFDRDGVTMIVSRGIGWHSIPIRVFNKAEIVCVSINSKG